MNRYFALSSGLHVIAALFLLMLLSPSVSKPQATYTIDFIGTGKVQAVTGQETAAPAAPAAAPKAEEKIAEPAKTATPEPEKPKETPKKKSTAKKAYTAKSEITTKKQNKKKKVEVAEPLAAPSILEEDAAKAAQSAQGAQEAAGEFSGASIQTDFADFPYPWYITQVRNSLWIEWEKRRPEGSLLSALVSFAIARNGKIKNVKIERSSKDETFDYAARSAVLGADPFAPLPMYYEKDLLTISVEFRQEN